MNLEKRIKQITDDFSEDEVKRLFNKELDKIIKKGWKKEGYATKKEWYNECGNGEVEEVVIAQIIESWREKYQQREIPEKTLCEMHDWLREEYQILNR